MLGNSHAWSDLVHLLVAELFLPDLIDLLVFGGIPLCLSAFCAHKHAARQTYSLHSALMVVGACALAFFLLTMVGAIARSDDPLPPSTFIAVASLFLGTVPAILGYTMTYRFYLWYARRRSDNQ